jgi:HSP20 family protein
MAEPKTSVTSSEGQTIVPRRGEYGPGRDLFGFNPFSMMRRFGEEMDRAFSSALGHTRGFGEWGSWSPPVEVRERDGNVEISAELPGLTKDDVKVECTNEGITIEGEKRSHVEKDERGFHRSERSYGHFYRMIPLPAGAETQKAKADFKDGVLQVKIPLSEQARSKRRQIPIGS